MYQHVAKINSADEPDPEPTPAPDPEPAPAADPEPAPAADPEAAPAPREVPPPPVREVPPPPPVPAAAASAQEEENADEDEDGGEKYVLVAPAPTPIESLKSMCEGCVAVEDIRGGMALLEFESERGARDAVTALASKQCDAEIARRTLWQDDLDDADLTSTTLHVDGVSAAIHESIVQQVFGTYGVAMSATRVGGDGASTVHVKMAERRGAETAMAALSGVYRFEEAQEFPVRITWCATEPTADGDGAAVGAKRKRDDGEDGPDTGAQSTAAATSTKQLLAIGLPATVASEEEVAGWLAEEGAACLFLDKERRCAVLAFPTADAATMALDLHGGTLRPGGNPCPVTLRRISCDVSARPRKRAAVASPPPGVWPPAPKPGPEFGEPSPKIYIGSIPQEYQEDDVRRIFECVGEIKEVKILRRPDDGRHKGSGFVTYADVAATERAIHFINDKYTLIAPNHATQKPIYMKYAKLGGVRPGVPVAPMGYQQPMAYQQPYGHYQQPYGHYPPQQQAYGHYPPQQQAYGHYPPQGPTQQQQQQWQQGFGGAPQ